MKMNFKKLLVKYFKSSISGSKNSVECLVEIEKRFPKKYELLKKGKKDPENLFEVIRACSVEEQNALFLIFARAGSIGRKMGKLFDLTSFSENSPSFRWGMNRQYQILAELSKSI